MQNDTSLKYREKTANKGVKYAYTASGVVVNDE